MTRINKLLPVLMTATTLGYSAEYIIPPEYDNLVNAQSSKNEVLITNSSPLFSSSNFILQGVNLKYRCVALPKINCGNGYAPKMIASIKKAPVLKDSARNQQITAYQIDVQVEDHGNNFYVCGAGVGAITWDTSSFVPVGKKYNYNYTPESKQVKYFFFTNISGNVTPIDGIGGGSKRGSSKSYMVVDVEQVCR